MLLLFTFLMGLGAVMNDPAWQAITPEIVSHHNLASAVALNSAGFNIARAVGPALGGMIIASAGSGAVFLLNAASFFGVILVLHRWKRKGVERPLAGQPLFHSILSGFHYVRQAKGVKAALVRTAMFSFSGGALLALLPVVARPFGAVGYGLLLGCFGVGAMAGAAVRHWIRGVISVDNLVASATVLLALMTFAVFLALAGMGWINIIASLNVAVQTTCPGWVRGRAISIYLLVLQGGLASGSTVWGAVAAGLGLRTALTYSASALLAGLVVIPWCPLVESPVPIAEAAVTP